MTFRSWATKYWRRLRRLTIGIGAIVAIVMLLLLVRGKPAEQEAEPVVRVETARAVIKQLVTPLEALGTVEARPGHIANVSAPEASRVTAVHVAIGDVVRAGQPLVQLDKAVFTARRREAEVALTAAQQAYDRVRRLLAEGVAPRKDVETATTDLAKARADLEQARRTEALATLRTPINGVVVGLNATLSMPVDITTAVVRVVDPRGLDILFHLAPKDAGRVQRGLKVELSSIQDSTTYRIGTGTVTGVSAAIDSTTGTVDVRATIGVPARPLKVGESLDGSLLIRSPRATVVVPVEAIVPEADRTIVYVVDANNIAHAITVTVGYRTETEVEILSGLKGGEIVVTHGAYGVADSAKVVAGPPR